MTEKNPENLNDKIDEIITDLTRERINQELSHISTDGMKANALAGISVIFAILSVSEKWTLFANFDNYLFVPFFISLILVSLSFIFAILVLRPRKNRFNLWLPKQSDETYSKMSFDNVKKEIKKEYIGYFESIQQSRKDDSKFIKWGYLLLVVGSIAMLITLIISEIMI